MTMTITLKFIMMVIITAHMEREGRVMSKYAIIKLRDIGDINLHTYDKLLVTCEECKFWSENTQFCHMFSTRFTAQRMLPNDFCSLGVKKESE